MGTKVIVVLWLLGIADRSVTAENIVKTLLADNISEESVSRLYRNAPVGIYASNAPYAAYSFNVPTVLAPKNIPVKEETILVQNTNGFLKDSYGNKFLQTPQALAYRTTFPRQYVQLQNLPAHLSQPLVSPSSQFKQLTPHFFSASPYNVQGVQPSPQTTLSRYTVQPLAYGNIQTLTANPIFYNQYQPQTAQQQSAGNKNVYAHAAPALENFNNIQADPKFQRLQQGAQSNFHNIDKTPSFQHAAQSDNSQKLQQAPKQRVVTTLSNGQKISVNLVTQPSLPLLDLNLLQPLTFANPVVPQVQHYLPRLNEETYKKPPNVNVDEVKTHQMEFVVQNTKSYDSEDKPENKKNVAHNDESAESNENSHPHTTEDEASNQGPEFTYENNSPNYKKTYTEQKVSYDKETESEPQTYNYETKIEGKPIHYSYEKNTNKKPIVVSYEHHIEKVPVQHTYEEHTGSKPIHYTYFKTVKDPVHYTTKNTQSPKHLVYTIKSEDQDRFEKNKGSRHHTRDNSDVNSEESDENRKSQGNEDRNKEKNHGHHVRYVESSKDTKPFKPEDNSIHYYHTNNQQDPNIVKHYHIPQIFINHVHKSVAPKQREQEHFEAVPNEGHIKHLHKGHDNIRVDPNQHVQPSRNSPPTQNHPVIYEYTRPHYSAAPIVKGKTKPEQNESVEEKIENEDKAQENDEENFEKSYKDAAYGFDAYDSPRVDSERDVYDPESYGAPSYYSEYNIDKSPLKQYESVGDDFPKYTRSNYKDERDKTHEDYFLDYAVSKPTSILDSYRNKEGYYKMYKKNKPENYYQNEDDKKQYAKYTVPSFEFYLPKQKQQKQNSNVYEHDYSNEEPRDASAYATRPVHRYKSKTHFVEPQFQYGFEPISIPQLLDSELAAMASNNNPKSEKQGTRKKIYKENLYIKKTSTKSGKKISR